MGKWIDKQGIIHDEKTEMDLLITIGKALGATEKQAKEAAEKQYKITRKQHEKTNP